VCSLSSLALVLKVYHPLRFDTSVVLYMLRFGKDMELIEQRFAYANSISYARLNPPRALC
jgi:hypothetical protein